MTDSVALPAIVMTEAREEIGSDIWNGESRQLTGTGRRQILAFSLIRNHQIPINYIYKCSKILNI